MTKSHLEFIEAVDIVCGECIVRSEETCEDCPVRKTCDALNAQDNEI